MTGLLERTRSVDWARISGDLDARGCATIPGLLAPTECDSLVALYEVASDRPIRRR